MRIHHLFYAALLGLTIATPSAAQTAATTVTGTWKASFVTEDRTYPAGLELKQDGEKLTGNLLSDTKDPIVGSVEGQNVSFTLSDPESQRRRVDSVDRREMHVRQGRPFG